MVTTQAQVEIVKRLWTYLMTCHDVLTDIIGVLMENVKESQEHQQEVVAMLMTGIQMLTVTLKTEVIAIVFLMIKKSPNIDGCQGQADCFRGKVTDIVDGDTLDISNVRIRLSLVNAPERGDDGYVEAKDFVESVCSIGTEAVVDEDDGQKEGSYDRLIGLVYCGDANMHDKISLNELLLQNGHAAVFEDFCSKSEFSLQNWVQSF